jgi:hypothetical protein
MKYAFISIMCGPNGFSGAIEKILPGSLQINPKDSPATIENRLDTFDPDVVFFQIQDDFIPLSIPEKLIKAGKTVINWTGDKRNTVPDWMLKWPKETILLFSNGPDVSEARKKGFTSNFLQCGFDPDIYYSSDKPREPKIVFMGNYCPTLNFPLTPFRLRAIRVLAAEFGEDFLLYGNYPNAICQITDQEKEAEIYRQNLIAINISHFNAPMYTSDRAFRAMGCGAELISLAFTCDSQILGSGHFGQDNFHSFETIDQLLNLCHGIRGGHIGRLGQKAAQFVHTNNTFERMICEIITLSNLYKK